MNYRSSKALALFVLLCSSLAMQTGYAARHQEHYTQKRSATSPVAADIILPVLGVAGLATGIFALGQWFGWWSESDEQLWERAQMLQKELAGYESMLHICGPHAYQALTFDESLLYQLALKKRGSAPIGLYIAHIKDTIKKASSLVNDLRVRSATLKRDKDWYMVQDICCRFDLAAQAIVERRDELEGMLGYLSMHTSYFQLFECEDAMRNTYAQALDLIEIYDAYQVVRALRAWIMTRHTGSFALIDFVKKLRNDVAVLEKAVTYPAYNYATRIGYARDLLDRLQYIQKVIVADGEYTALLAEYERAQRERERLQLERERISAERRTAYALERDAAARERQAYAQETKNALKAAELADRIYNDRGH